jgi:hypothetical protein
VTLYNDLRELYMGYPSELQSGVVIPGSAIQQTYADMTTAWDTSEDRQTWRNVFMVSFLVVYTVNLVDILRSEPDTGERPPTDESAASLRFEVQGDDVRVYKAFSF